MMLARSPVILRSLQEAWGRPDASGDPAALGARGVFSRGQRIGLLAGFVLLVMARLPRAWVHGRFMDEEGTIFFAYAWHRPWADALGRSFAGYLNLGANGVTLAAARLVAAGILPLGRAPYFTMLVALAFQTIPAVLILTGRARFLTSRWAVIVALLIVAISPRVEEVYFNVLHIQFHLALAAALVLALDAPTLWSARIAYGAILFLAPLCGPGAIILLPFFVARALLERSGARAVQTGAFVAGTALQMLGFFAPNPLRGHLLGPATLAAILFTRLMALPAVTSGPANKLGKLIHASHAAQGVGWWIAVAAAILYFGALVWLALRHRRDAAIWLIAPGLAIGAASFGGGMLASDSRQWFSVGAGQRYNFLPLVMVTLGLLVLARRTEGGHRRWCLAMCVLTLISGAVSMVKPNRELRNGPSWPAEVALWRADHDHALATWPAEWAVDLSDRDRPCTPPRIATTTADPSYCESAWLVRVEVAMAAVARDKD